MTSHYDVIRDITWHVCQGYKTAWCGVVGDTLVQLLLGKEVHVHAWIDALARPRWESLLPSNITDWVVLIRPCASAFVDAPITLRERPGNAVFFLRSTASTGPSCLSAGARVHYLLSCCLHLRKHSAATATDITSARRMSHVWGRVGRIRDFDWILLACVVCLAMLENKSSIDGHHVKPVLGFGYPIM